VAQAIEGPRRAAPGWRRGAAPHPDREGTRGGRAEDHLRVQPPAANTCGGKV